VFCTVEATLSRQYWPAFGAPFLERQPEYHSIPLFCETYFLFFCAMALHIPLNPFPRHLLTSLMTSNGARCHFSAFSGASSMLDAPFDWIRARHIERMKKTTRRVPHNGGTAFFFPVSYFVLPVLLYLITFACIFNSEFYKLLVLSLQDIPFRASAGSFDLGSRLCSFCSNLRNPSSEEEAGFTGTIHYLIEAPTPFLGKVSLPVVILARGGMMSWARRWQDLSWRGCVVWRDR